MVGVCVVALATVIAAIHRESKPQRKEDSCLL